MDETTSKPEDAALSHSDSGPLERVRDPGGLESEGLTLRSGSILRGRTPHPSQMSNSQALTEFDMVTVQGQAGLSPIESETVTSYTVSAAAADLSLVQGGQGRKEHGERKKWEEGRKEEWTLSNIFRGHCRT